jgi:hypothetical protein
VIESKYGIEKGITKNKILNYNHFFPDLNIFWKDDNDVEDSACDVESSNADQQGDRSCNDAEFKTTTTTTARATTTTTNGQVQIYILALLYLT